MTTEERAKNFWKVGQLYRGTHFTDQYFLVLGRHEDRLYGVRYNVEYKKKRFKAFRNFFLSRLEKISDEVIIRSGECSRNAYFFGWKPVPLDELPEGTLVKINSRDASTYCVAYDFWVVGETYYEPSTSNFAYGDLKVLAVGKDTVFVYGRCQRDKDPRAFYVSKDERYFTRQSDGRTNKPA